MLEGCKTSETLFNLMMDLGTPDVAKPLPMFNDNRGAVDWLSGCTVSKKLRHLNICKVAVRDAQKAGIFHIRQVPGHSNVADIFTKEQVRRHVLRIGISASPSAGSTHKMDGFRNL
jgi:hypothetical protein